MSDRESDPEQSAVPFCCGISYPPQGVASQNRMIGAFEATDGAAGPLKRPYEEFKKMKLEIFEPGVQVLYKPHRKTL